MTEKIPDENSEVVANQVRGLFFWIFISCLLATALFGVWAVAHIIPIHITCDPD